MQLHWKRESEVVNRDGNQCIPSNQQRSQMFVVVVRPELDLDHNQTPLLLALELVAPLSLPSLCTGHNLSLLIIGYFT